MPKDIMDNDGAICTFKLKIDDSMSIGKYSAAIKNAKYSLSSGTSKVKMGDATCQIT